MTGLSESSDSMRTTPKIGAAVAEQTMKLSVVVPCFNEAATIATVIARVRACGVESLELIVVDDGSTDGTIATLRGDLMAEIDTLVLHETNSGKGAALRSGISRARGDLVVIQDADLEYDPAEYAALMAPFLTGNAEVVYGSRFVGGRPHRVMYFWHMVGNRLLTLLSNALTNLNLTDMETGFKMFRREVIQAIEIEENRFGFEPEITAKLARRGCVFYEVGISYRGRTYAEGKKIHWQDGVRAVYAILKYNLGPAKPGGPATDNGGAR